MLRYEREGRKREKEREEGRKREKEKERRKEGERRKDDHRLAVQSLLPHGPHSRVITVSLT